jgi:hypothetical protein
MRTVRSTTYSSPTAGSSGWWRFMRMAVSLRWQRSVGKVARACKPYSVPRVPPSGFSSRSPGTQKDVACSVDTGHGTDSVLPKSRVRLRPSLSRAGPGISRVQRCAQSQAAARALAAMMRDRGDDDDTLQITQSLLAQMLGVQRPAITNAAWELERAGLIVRGRRQVTILDPGPLGAILRMLSVGPGARRFSPSQNIRAKVSPPNW